MSLPVPHQPLLTGRDIARLPAFLPLDLFELPIVRGTDRQTRNPDGSLAEEDYRQEIVIRGEGGQEYRVLIQGDSVLGRPYGFDAGVLIAIFMLVRIHRAWDGVLPSPSFGQIARAMDLDPGHSTTLRRIRESIDRLRRTMLVFTYERDIPTVEDILAGDDAPSTPGKRRRVKTSPNEWLIRANLSDVDGSLRLESLAVNPIFIRQGAAGALLFIDPKVHNQQASPAAQRLYAIAAALKAQFAPLPWTMSLDRLQALCADQKPLKKFKPKITAAGQSLITDGVLASFEILDAKRRGDPPIVVMQPGALLGLAGLLRGVGMMDPDDVATHMLVLAEMGMPMQERRNLIANNPGGVHWTLLYLEFARQKPEAAGLKNGLTHPLPFFRKKIGEQGFEQDAAFQKWLAAEIQPRPAPVGRAAQKKTLAAAPRERPAGEPAAVDLWNRVRARMTGLDIDERLMLSGVRAVAIRDGVLICESGSPTTLEFMETPRIRSLVASAARQESSDEVEGIAMGLAESPTAS